LGRLSSHAPTPAVLLALEFQRNELLVGQVVDVPGGATLSPILPHEAARDRALLFQRYVERFVKISLGPSSAARSA
jgi:hypothetical protein